MAVTFDTHKLITRLTQGQMTLEQAEAVSEALSQALEGSLGQLATKPDLDTLRTTTKADLDHLEKRLTWMIGVNGALTLAVLGKVLFFMQP
jgi:hypothetical protein